MHLLAPLRIAGVLAGVSTHKPEVIEYIEERGWDVDFYMGCAYNRTRTPDEIRKLLGQLPLPPNELYLENDPERMFAVMRQTRKTCFAFKILAAALALRSVGSRFSERSQLCKPIEAGCCSPIRHSGNVCRPLLRGTCYCHGRRGSDENERSILRARFADHPVSAPQPEGENRPQAVSRASRLRPFERLLQTSRMGWPHACHLRGEFMVRLSLL